MEKVEGRREPGEQVNPIIYQFGGSIIRAIYHDFSLHPSNHTVGSSQVLRRKWWKSYKSTLTIQYFQRESLGCYYITMECIGVSIISVGSMGSVEKKGKMEMFSPEPHFAPLFYFSE